MSFLLLQRIILTFTAEKWFYSRNVKRKVIFFFTVTLILNTLFYLTYFRVESTKILIQLVTDEFFDYQWDFCSKLMLFKYAALTSLEGQTFPKVNIGPCESKQAQSGTLILSLRAADVHDCTRVSSPSGWFWNTDSTDDLLLLQKPFNVITPDILNV